MWRACCEASSPGSERERTVRSRRRTMAGHHKDFRSEVSMTKHFVANALNRIVDRATALAIRCRGPRNVADSPTSLWGLRLGARHAI